MEIDNSTDASKEKCFFCGKELDVVLFRAIINGKGEPFCNRGHYAKWRAGELNLLVVMK